MVIFNSYVSLPEGIVEVPTILWMVAKSCATWDARKHTNNGILPNYYITGAGFRNHPQYVCLCKVYVLGGSSHES